jgi:hypothetical protein
VQQLKDFTDFELKHDQKAATKLVKTGLDGQTIYKKELGSSAKISIKAVAVSDSSDSKNLWTLFAPGNIEAALVKLQKRISTREISADALQKQMNLKCLMCLLLLHHAQQAQDPQPSVKEMVIYTFEFQADTQANFWVAQCWQGYSEQDQILEAII